MKNNVILYFTGTGNSLKVARDISAKLSFCDIYPMSNFSGKLSSYDRIGFVFPVYAGGLPKVVKEFLINLNLSENMNSYYFAVATCGTQPTRLLDTLRPILKGKMINVGYGNSISDINDLLKIKGVRLNYGNRIVAYSNNVLLHDMDNDIKSVTASAQQEAEHIAFDINAKVKKVISQKKLFYKLINNTFQKQVNNTDQRFSTNNNCISCGVCSKICPVNNIIMVDGKPTFSHKCEQCIACIQWCPKQAINYKDITQNRKRYHHPAIIVNDMIINKR